MKLIIEKRRWPEASEDNLYAYIVSKEQFDITSAERKNLQKLSPNKILNQECDLNFLPQNSYLVFNLHPLENFEKNED